MIDTIQLPTDGRATSFQSLCPGLACSCACHIFLLFQLTTLTIHNSLSLSLPAQDLPFSQIFPTIDSLPASGLTPRLYDCTVSSEYLGFYSARNARIASAVLATAIPSVCPSVCLSVTRRYCVKTTAHSTVQFALSDSKMYLVL